MQPLSSDREEKEGGVTRIDWSLIISVQASERNPKEFTILAMPEGKKNKAIKGQPQSMVFTCKERNRLLTEMIHKLHDFQGENPMMTLKALHQTDIYKLGLKRQGLLKLHPTILQVIVRSKYPMKGIEESKKLFEDSQDESELYDENATDDYFLELEEDFDIDLLESEGQGISDTVLTPYKGSMIGGTIVGDESVQPGTVGNDHGSGPSYRQHFIYLCEIQKIILHQNSIIIVQKNQDIDKFVLKSEEAVNELAGNLKNNYKESFKSPLTVEIVQSFDYDNLFEDQEYVKKAMKAIFTQEATSYSWDGQISELSIEMDEQSIFEIDKKLRKIRKRCSIKDLEMIAQVRKELILVFKKETEMILHCKTSAEREKLVSAILTLRQFIVPNQGAVDLLTINVNSQIDYSLKIFGHDPLDNAQYIQEYEGLLFRKLTENINYKDSLKINNLIEEALLNASFATLLKIDPRSIKIIIKEITQQIEKYVTFEFQYPQIVEQILKKTPDDHIIDFYGFKRIQINSQETHLQKEQIFTDEIAEKAKSYEKLQEITGKYLSILNLLLNSRAFLAEIQEHEDLVQFLIKMLICKNAFLSLQASQVLKQIIHHYSGNEAKLEQINKRLLVKGKAQGNPSNFQEALFINSSTQNQEIQEPVYFIKALKDYLLYFQSLYESQSIVKSLHIFALQNLMRSFLQTRKASTGKDELKNFADLMIEDDKLYLKIVGEEKQLNQGPSNRNDAKKEDPLRNKPIFHLVDKFSLLSNENFDVQYFFTMMLNEALSYFKRFEIDKLASFQQYNLTYSIQFIWHLYLQMSAPLKEQRKQSIQTLSKILYQNYDAISLLLRCFPKTLIEKVETHIDLIQSQAWGDQEWEDFFMKVTYKDYDTATDQWNNETRAELQQRLQQELTEFQQAKKIHQQVIQDHNKRELVLPNHEFNRDKQVISRSINLKWNYMEFGVKYQCLTSKYLVWKYYLTKLLVETNLSETQQPYFTLAIQKPLIFWQELKIKFMSSFDPMEQIIILKTMCVLYNTHYQQLKELKSIPYLLKLFQQQQYEHCHFILIQLMHVALSIEREYSLKNMKKFIKSDGLQIIMNQMKLVFKELLRQDKGQSVEQNPQLIVLSTFSRDKFEKLVHGSGLLKDQANFTNSKTNSRYFKRNSEYVCMGILCLKILDLIFKEMYAIDYVPLPTNREFLLRPISLAIMTQTLMVENVDLTRELTIFIQSHMNNHYSYFKLKNSGMIEYLILCLVTKNGDRALEILQKFQEVSFDFNNNLKLGLFNSNDLNMLQDDKIKIYKAQIQVQTEGDFEELKKLIILAESIFLRYLPIPFIKFLYEEGQEKFLEIYKMPFYESPILIWNSKLRQILEDSIREHSQEFIESLKHFANQSCHELKLSDDIPIYSKKFKNIVRYPDIESEVRCGRYYLRVWVNQKKKDVDFFDIPREEEDEFHKNLQIELRHCIYEENFKDQQKIIILFKACLLALNRFSTKRIVSLDEVKKILMDTCKNQPFYTDTVKQMVYIGIKIINLVVRQETQSFFQNTVKNNADSLREVLTKIGVEIIGEIFNLILRNSFNSSHLSMDYSRNAQQDQENSDSNQFLKESIVPHDQNKKITMDRIEAKTLSLCIQSFNIILNTDIQAFVDYPLSNRINLFKQISRLIDVSYDLLPLFKDKQLSNNIYQFDSTTYGSYNQQAIVSPKGKTNRKKSKTKKNKSKKRQNQINQMPTNNQHSWQQANMTNNQSNYNPQIGQIFSKPNQNQLFIELEKYAQSKQNDTREKRKIKNKDPNIDYKNQSLLQIINDKMDKHSIELIFDITKSIFELTREITKFPVLHPELIASGMAWKALKYNYFSLKEETSQFQDLRASLREATVTLKNLISFTHQLANYGAESFAFKNLTKETEKEIMQNFWKCIKSIFAAKIQDTLITQAVVSNNQLLFAAYDPRRFLQQFQVREENSPELVWNNETRSELFEALDRQIQNLHVSFFDFLSTFDYNVNRRELKVEDIFVRHFNNQNEYRPPDLEKFISKLFEKLKDYIDFKFIADLNKDQYQNTIELLKAIKILLVNENFLINDQDKFEDYLATLSNMIQLKVDDQGNYHQIQEEIDSIKGISHIILGIMLHISKSGGLHFDYLKNNNDFIRLLIRALYGKEKEYLDSQEVIHILQNMLSSKDIDINQFLINTGLIMFLLNQIFEKKPQNTNKMERVELIKLLILAQPYTQGIYSKFIPHYFFVEIKQINDLDTERIIEFIKEFDANEFENVFIIWNTMLRNENHLRIKNNCDQILKSYDDSYFQFNLDLADLYNPKFEQELIVSDVIMRIFNKNPAVFINIKLNSFIYILTQEIQKVAQDLYKLGQQYKEDFALDDFIGRDSLSGQSQQTQRKFKCLCNQSLILLTSLLLSLEQLLLNEFNPNRLMATKKEGKNQDKNTEAKFVRQIIEKLTDQTQLDHKVYQIISFWLQTQVFMARYIPIEIRLTFLQIIFLVIDVSDSVKTLKENGDSLLTFLYETISHIHAEKFSKTVEEAMVLLIAQKILRKDPDITPKLINNSMQKLFKISEKKKKLKKLVEFILYLMASDMQYKQSAVELIMQNQSSMNLDPKTKNNRMRFNMISGLVLDGRNENNEHTEAIMRIWRGKPTSESDAKRFYDIDECYHIEEKLDETNISKLKLPLLCKRSAQQFQRDELYFEEEKKKNYDMPVTVPKNLKAKSNDIAQIAQSVKETKLGYQPILDEVSQIGGIELEAIEKKEESFLEEDEDP